MRLKKARVVKYRSIRDSGWFDIEDGKTILVGPNEAGKTALLEALQQLNPPLTARNFDTLRDYPRSEYADFTLGKVHAEDVTVVVGKFDLDEEDREAVAAEFRDATYVLGRKLDNKAWHHLEGGAAETVFGAIAKDLAKLAAHVDRHVTPNPEESPAPPLASEELDAIIDGWADIDPVDGELAIKLADWLKRILPLIDHENQAEVARAERLQEAVSVAERRLQALAVLSQRVPVFVLFGNYFRVKPLIHLEHLAERLETGVLDDGTYDYGNKCLLQLLGFSARELSDLGKATEPPRDDAAALLAYRNQLDRRSYQLNTGSAKLSDEIRTVWYPDPKRGEAERLRVIADQQYLKVVVEDEMGVEIELDQRSEGFQWLVSFFIVFFAEALGRHQNAILLLDEPGMSLHGLKQRDFRSAISRLAESNQTIFTTHSPFLVGANELDLVRVVELADRKIGTKVHSCTSASDPIALLPLQEALGYDLAQSLFTEERNLVVEDLTDYWYLEAVSQLLREADIVDLNREIAVVPAGGAGKVVYFATILHAHKLKVAALLDSDAAGELAAQQKILVHALGNKAVLRTRDSYEGVVKDARLEDLLRTTLVKAAKSTLRWDVASAAAAQPELPIVKVFEAEIEGFSRYKLAKAFLRWTRTHEASDLTDEERNQWKKLIDTINATLK
jgi:energy-coupling factor transporter ATP-binding protein EcfA2